jgi:hypothetical protein
MKMIIALLLISLSNFSQASESFTKTTDYENIRAGESADLAR